MKRKRVLFLRKELVKLLISIFLFAVFSISANAASFSDINQSSVFLKQQTSYTCTLSAATMMVRRAAMATGKTNWPSITESAMRGTAWLEGTGLYHSFTYAGISVRYGTLNGGSANVPQLISLLNSHPEGIVVYDRAVPHAILITDYTNGTFYCADPANNVAAGRIPVSLPSITINNADNYWYVSSPKCTIMEDTTSPVISNIKITNKSNSGFTVTCTVTDNAGVDRVQFPVWTRNKGQDDLDPDWWSSNKSRGSKNG